MTSPARYRPLAPEAGTRIDIASQATAIEQSRAVAEVQAAVLVAQQRPRNKAAAVEEMRDATAQQSVAEKAYFRYRRGGENVTGVSIHLARELARCWGNIDYGIKELSRDDGKGSSEMLAHAWDMQTNARASTTFIVPHVRDTKAGAKKLTETRDIYENNANSGARRLREQILAILPNWFVEEAKANCDKTIEEGGGRPLAQRVADAIRLFDAIGVMLMQLEAKLGRQANDWTGHDVGQLGVIYTSIQRGETTVDNEFDSMEAAAIAEGVSAADITAAAGRANRTAEDTEQPQETKPARPRRRRAEPLGTAGLERAKEMLVELKVTTDTAQLAFVRDLFEIPDLADLSQLDESQIARLLSELVDLVDADQVAAKVDGRAEGS